VGGESDKILKIQEKLPDIFGNFLKQNHRPAKFSYSFFLKVAQKFGRIENFARHEGQGSRMPLVTAAHHDLLRRVPACSNQGRNDEGQETQLPGCRITMKSPNDCGAPKSPNNVTRTSVRPFDNRREINQLATYNIHPHYNNCQNNCNSTMIHMSIERVLAYAESNGVTLPLHVDDH